MKPYSSVRWSGPGFVVMFVLLLGVNSASAQKKVTNQREETPNQRFFRKGGKETKAKVFVNNGELTAIDIQEDRDVSLYEDRGHFNCRKYQSPASTTSCDLSKLRDLLWNHWQKKVRGYFRITADSVDAVSTSHIFIEPDHDMNWKVSWRIVRHNGVINDVPRILNLNRRVATSPSDCWTGCGNGSGVLSFIDWEGEEIQVI